MPMIIPKYIDKILFELIIYNLFTNYFMNILIKYYSQIIFFNINNIRIMIKKY